MKRQEVMKLQTRAAIEAFIGDNIEQYTENKLGIDWRIVLEERRITPYIRNLINQSKYFSRQCGDREEVEVIEQLIYSRLIECRLLEKWGDKAKLNGTDSEKLITEYSSYSPDIKESVPGAEDYYYEVISTFHGAFILNSVLSVREGKLNYLVNFAKLHNVYIVAVDVLAKRYCFIPIRGDFNEMDYVRKGALYGYSIDLRDLEWFSLLESDYVVNM